MPNDVSAEQLDFVRIDAELVERAVAELKALERKGAKAVSEQSCTGARRS